MSHPIVCQKQMLPSPKKVWKWLDWRFEDGKGHTLDFFALDINAMCDC